MQDRMNKSILVAVVGSGMLLVGGYVFYSLRSEINNLKKLYTYQASKKALSLQPIQHDNQPVDDQSSNVKGSWLSVQRKVKDTVVQVFANTVDFNWLEPYKTPKQGLSTGSGFFINEEGDIISNYHVVAQAVNVQIQIPSCGLERFDTEIVGVSPERDIALLRLTQEALEKIKNRIQKVPFLTLGNSDEILRSHEVMALGYPLGQARLKSSLGIVSGRERLGYFGYIQITTPLNPGNSGGPALNDQGKVIGINTAVAAGAQGVGYIIPINEVSNALQDLRDVKLLRKPILGGIFTYSSPEMVNYLNNPEDGGWYVAKVFDNTLLKQVGIQDGDMIYEVDGLRIDMYGEFNVSWSEDKVSFFELLNRYNIDEEIHFLVYRQGEPLNFTVKFESKYLPAVRVVYPEFEPETVDYEVIGGLTVMNLTLNHINVLLQNCPDLIKYGRIDNQQKSALLLTQIIPNSQGYEARILRPGEIIEEVNDEKVTTLAEFRQAILKSKKSRFIKIKTTDNLCAVLSVDKILKDEPVLANRYHYTISKLAEELA